MRLLRYFGVRETEVRILGCHGIPMPHERKDKGAMKSADAQRHPLLQSIQYRNFGACLKYRPEILARSP